MKKKTIIFDLDGTAVDSPTQKIPSKRLVQAVKNLQQYHYLSAATGRAWTFGKDILRGLGLKDPCIISGGTQICDPQTGKIIWQKNIPSESLDRVIKIYATNGQQKLIFNDYSEDDYFYGGVLPKDFDTSLKVNWISQSFVPDELAIRLQKELAAVDGVTCVMVVSQKPGCRDLHVVNEHATKEHAVAVLLEMLGLSKKDAKGIGDGHNDLHLFNAVGEKIAMGNAVEELKNAADLVIGEVQHEGLAEYFEKIKANS